MFAFLLELINEDISCPNSFNRLPADTVFTVAAANHTYFMSPFLVHVNLDGCAANVRLRPSKVVAKIRSVQAVGILRIVSWFVGHIS